MKKLFLSIGVLALLGIGFVATACSKDDISDGCDCTYSLLGVSEDQHFTREEVETTGSSTCKEFASWSAKQTANIGTWECK